MRAIDDLDGKLGWTTAEDPKAGDGELVLDVVAAGINRADLLQRQGGYAPPVGASPILGLECSGVISAVGPGVDGWAVGDEVCALLAGGGYAERVAVPAVQVLPRPASVSLVEAAALPEVACTVWSTLVMAARAGHGDTVLIHGGSGGVGTFAIQLGVALGMRVAVTAGSSEALRRCAALGAEILINHRTDDFVAALAEATSGRGADVILDLIGAKYLNLNVSALADGGRLAIIGLQGGRSAEFNLGTLLGRRASVIGTTLRSRPVSGPGSKAEIVAAVKEHVWPLVESGAIRPVVGAQLPMERAEEGHRMLLDAPPGGKILLTVS
jgi:putative PIG3 family NAD(P)H quinone oxidoreductase